MTKESIKLIKQMTKNYKPTGQKPIKTNKASLRESMIQCCYEIAHNEAQMQLVKANNPEMFQYLKDKFQEIDPERENFVYFPREPKERGGKMNARRRNDWML